MTDYTKGEWKVSGSGKRVWVTHEDASVVPIAEIRGENEEAKANAHLIAAAPAMYEALKAIDVFGNRTEYDLVLGTNVTAKIIKALSKAEGK